LLSDPAETKNVAPNHKKIASSLLEDYRDWANQHWAVRHYQVLDAYEAYRTERGYCHDQKCIIQRAMKRKAAQRKQLESSEA